MLMFCWIKTGLTQVSGGVWWSDFQRCVCVCESGAGRDGGIFTARFQGHGVSTWIWTFSSWSGRTSPCRETSGPSVPPGNGMLLFWLPWQSSQQHLYEDRRAQLSEGRNQSSPFHTARYRSVISTYRHVWIMFTIKNHLILLKSLLTSLLKLTETETFVLTHRWDLSKSLRHKRDLICDFSNVTMQQKEHGFFRVFDGDGWDRGETHTGSQSC